MSKLKGSTFCTDYAKIEVSRFYKPGDELRRRASVTQLHSLLNIAPISNILALLMPTVAKPLGKAKQSRSSTTGTSAKTTVANPNGHCRPKVTLLKLSKTLFFQ